DWSSGLRSWTAPWWQVVALGVVIWGVSLWLTRTQWRTRLGFLSMFVRAVLVAILLFAAQGWQARRLVEQPHRVTFVLDLSASMATADRTNETTAADSDASTDEVSATESPGESSRLGQALSELPRTMGEQQAWLTRFGEQRRLDWYSVGQQLERHESWSELRRLAEHPDQPASRLGTCLGDLVERNMGRPLSAVILVTDAVSTDANSRELLREQLRAARVPWFPVLVGEDVERREIRIATQGLPATAFVGESLVVTATVELRAWHGGRLRVRLVDLANDETLASVTWEPREATTTATFPLVFPVMRPGANRLAVQLVEDANESVLGSGRTQRFEAIEHRTRVLIVSRDPVPEFRFLKHALERARQPGSTEVRSFAVSSWLQTADLEYADTDESAIRSFPADDALLSEFDVVVMIDPLLADQDPTRGLSRTDLERLRRHVETDAASLIVVANWNTNPANWSGTELESLLPCPLTELRYWSGGSGPQARLRQLVATPIGASYPSLREHPSWLSASTDASDEDDSLARDPRIRFPVTGVWLSRQLRPGVRPLLVLDDSTESQDLDVALTQQSVGRGVVLFQGFADAYRLRYRSEDERGDRYWLQTIRQLARHRWLDQNPRTVIASDRDHYRAGDTAWISVTTATNDGVPPVTTVSLADSGAKPLPLMPVGAQAGWFEAELTDLAPGQYLVTVEGTTATSRASFTFDVSPARTEADREPPDHEWLREIAQVTGGRVITPKDLRTPATWLPSPRRPIISVGPDRPIWDNVWLSLFFGCLVIGLLLVDWRLRDVRGQE
ncbi:MAG: hypothetical protein KDA83_14990, partial [Planctomycetales bacterium]|nr:hypothetical protein [Planctomycetales bacterium]